MRILTRCKPYAYGYELEALELLPCGSATKDDITFLIIRYKSLDPESMAGDHWYLTAQEALEGAEYYHKIKPSDWYLEGYRSRNDPIEILINKAIKYHREETGYIK